MIEVDHEQLKSLFKESERPIINKLSQSENSVLVDVHVPQSLAWFEGHFPEQAVLPGVVQIDWAGKLSRALLINSGKFAQLVNIKFKSMVLPNTDLTIELVYVPEKGNVKFHLFNQESSFSTGVLKFKLS